MDVFDALRVMVKQGGVVRYQNLPNAIVPEGVFWVRRTPGTLVLQFRSPDGMESTGSPFTLVRYFATYPLLWARPDIFIQVRPGNLAPVRSSFEVTSPCWLQAVTRKHPLWRKFDVFDALRVVVSSRYGSCNSGDLWVYYNWHAEKLVVTRPRLTGSAISIRSFDFESFTLAHIDNVFMRSTRLVR